MLLPSAVTFKGGGGPPGFTPNGLNFFNGGSGNNYLINPSLTGVVDSPLGSLSVWTKLNGGDGVQMLQKRDATNIRIDLQRGTSNVFSLRVFDNSGASFLEADGTTHITGTGWHHVLASWDTNHAAGFKVLYLYVDDADTSPVISDSSPAFNVGYTAENCVFSTNTTNNNTALSEIWYAPGVFIDFSLPANRALFSSGGIPISLGATGNLPTGTAPAVYLHNAAATAGINSGTGGNFTSLGTITDTAHP